MAHARATRPETFSSRLRRLRRERRLTLRELGERSGLSLQTIYQLESARHVTPLVQTAEALARGLGVPLLTLLFG